MIRLEGIGADGWTVTFAGARLTEILLLHIALLALADQSLSAETWRECPVSHSYRPSFRVERRSASGHTLPSDGGSASDRSRAVSERPSARSGASAVRRLRTARHR